MSTNRKISVIDINPGKYCHFGLLNTLSHLLTISNSDKDYLHIQFNVDGLPISKSSGRQFWPILGSVKELNAKVFEIGLYCGTDKPSSSNEFLKTLVDELVEICKEGIKFQNRIISVLVDSFVCDQPVRAFILNTKGHTGYFGCGKCEQQGVHINRRMTFPEVSAQLRTNESFRNNRNQEHHHFISELERVDFNIIQQVPFEFMHLVCLGVVKKLILLWTTGKNSKFRLSIRDKLELSRSLINLAPFVPSEFARKPRNVNEIRRWKATELRQFILYTGPIATQGLLSKDIYNHFVCLHFAITILCSHTLHIKYNNHAEKLLKYFVLQFPIIYGRDQVSFNVHGLVHLARDSLTLGPLDCFSAFKFENHLGYISKLLKGKNRPLEQVYNRICERNKLQKSTEITTSPGPTYISTNSNLTQSKVLFPHFTLSTRRGDNVCFTQCGKFMKIQEIVNCDVILIIGNLLKVIRPSCEIPASSSVLNQFLVLETQEHVRIPATLVKVKFVSFPGDRAGYSVIFPLIHI